MLRWCSSISLALAAVAAAQPAPSPAPPTAATSATLRCWPLKERPAYLAYERDLLAVPSRESLLANHQKLAAEPHIAGTPGDARVIETLARTFREIGEGVEGWTVEVDEFYAYLPRPLAAELEIVAPDRRTLELRERPLTADPAADAAIGAFAWLGYSGSGETTGEVVYANYGTKADFETLKKLGVDLRGRIVLCRYGGNYRGYKVKFAEEAGAAGVLIFTDPADAGVNKGPVYPLGGWANDCCIQRGSLLALGYGGDPLTPGWAATKEARRLDPSEVDLPKIPAQPIGYGAAAEILSRMKGRPLPEDLKAWAGGVSTQYRLEGGPELRVRLKVEQAREVVRSANVVATLRGRGEDAERKVVLGCHHDAWNNGAADPTCGTIAVLESARAFALLARRGERPNRTVVFAAWGGEEMGLIGSSEYVEKHRADLVANGVAYLNLDMASMGPNFGAAASPELKAVIADVARVVPQARDASRTVFDAWTAPKNPGEPAAPEPGIGVLGGGSDHVGFLMHAGVPSASLACGGSAGSSYHSAYDTLPWYWKVVGDDYEPALMITRMAAGVAARLASAPLIPEDAPRAGRDFVTHAETLSKAARDAGLNSAGLDALLAHRREALLAPNRGLDGLKNWFDVVGALHKTVGRLAGGPADPSDAVRSTREAVRDANDAVLRTSRLWLRDSGVPGRPWFHNAFVATDESSGYADWVLPWLRRAVETRDQKAFDEAVAVYDRILDALTPPAP